MKASEVRTAIFISGAGSTTAAVITACRQGSLKNINIPLVLANTSKAGQEVKRLGVEIVILPRRPKELTTDEYGCQLLSILKPFHIDLIAQLGWKIMTPRRVVGYYNQRLGVINQHPGPLDPEKKVDFGGQGMYGCRVMCGRLAYVWASQENPWTEAVAHFVTPNEQYDEGLLIRTQKMDLPPFSTKVTIDDLNNNPKYARELVKITKIMQAKLLPIEHANVIETLRMFATEGKVVGFKRSCPLVPPENAFLVEQAKELAIRLFPKG